MEHKIINCPHGGKTVSKDILDVNDVKTEVTCPKCGGQRKEIVKGRPSKEEFSFFSAATVASGFHNGERGRI